MRAMESSPRFPLLVSLAFSVSTFCTFDGTISDSSRMNRANTASGP